MALSEFNLIERYFQQPRSLNAHTRLGIGDDCAILSVPSGFELALTTDTMVENVHFIADCDPEALGHKLLAVNLSDLAAMGAQPIAIMLAVTLPAASETWLAAFAKGLFSLAQRYNVDLIGGDTTCGPLVLTVQAMGLLPTQQNLQRSCAQIGDLICMTGTLGDAGLGLKLAQGEFVFAVPHLSVLPLESFHRPEPQVAAGLAIRYLAHACIDISDGLLADLGHIAQKSTVAARIDWEKLPLSSSVQEYIALTDDWSMPLTAGDDYQLCFTISPENFAKLPLDVTCIGEITTGSGVHIYKAGKAYNIGKQGYEHFSA